MILRVRTKDTSFHLQPQENSETAERERESERWSIDWNDIEMIAMG